VSFSLAGGHRHHLLLSCHLQRGGELVASLAASPDASASGAWRQVLPRTPASLTPYSITVVAVGATIPPTVLTDVLFGDVYVIAGACVSSRLPSQHIQRVGRPSVFSSLTGQSNAQFTVDLGVNVSAELAAANRYPSIRLFTVGIGTESVVPLPQLQTLLQPWVRASNASVGMEPWGAFSAVGWYFGRDLFDLLGGTVPIGLIGNNWGACRAGRLALCSLRGCSRCSCACTAGGSPIECWSDPATLARCPANGPVDPTTASIMFNSMFVPYTQAPGPMAVQGWVWYQGESLHAHDGSAASSIFFCLLLHCNRRSERRRPQLRVPLTGAN
jgi:hypothetical protein